METLPKQQRNTQLAEEYRIVQKKLDMANESLRPFTEEQIREVIAKAEKEKRAGSESSNENCH